MRNPQVPPTPSRRCIFCGAVGVTKEHVFSRWSHRYMPPRQKGRSISLVGALYPDREETSLVKLPGQLRDWQIQCVCGGTHLTCNGGWMKRIEDRAKPILVPLIVGNAARLQPRDQAIIATWAILKVMVSEYDEIRGHVTTHWTQRRRMRVRQVPPENGWGVWIGHYERVNWKPEWISLPFFVPSDAVLARRGQREPTYYNGSSVTQVIGKLFIQVIHSPVPEDFIERWRFPPEKGTLVRIWPLPAFSIKWPQRALSDREADRIADAIPQFLRKVSQQVVTLDLTP